MLTEHGNQFSLTRAALSTYGRAKTKFLSVAFHVGARLRRDRLIRKRLREGSRRWQVVELRAPDLARGAALVQSLTTTD